jgi:tetratricopeptide (TPR) repeat protein
LRRAPSFSTKIFASQLLTAVLLFASTVVAAAQSVDTADEARAISRQVSALILARSFKEAEALANKGMALCEGAVGVRGFCLGQFNDSLGDIARLTEQYPNALIFYQRAIETRKGLPDSGNALASASQWRLGTTYLALHRRAEAEFFLKKAIAGFANAAPLSPNLTAALGYLRQLYAESGRIDEEVAVARNEVEFREKAGSSDTQALWRSKLFLNTALLRQAKILSARNNDVDAEKALIEAIKLIDPPQSGSEKYLSVSLENLAIIYDKLHRYAEAEALFLRALEYREKLAEPSDSDLPTILFNLASVYQNWGRGEASVQYWQRAIAKFDEAKIQNSLLGFALYRLGDVQKALGRSTEAEPSFLRALDVLDRVLPENDPQRINVRLALGNLQSDAERYSEAERSLSAALELTQKYSIPDTSWRSSALASLGLLYRDQVKFDEAERLLSQAIELEEAAGHERTSFLGQRLTALATILLRENRFADAETTLSRALTLEQPELDRATTLNALGVVYTSTARHELAEPLLKEAFAIREKGLASNSILTIETSLNLASVDLSRGNFAEAEVKLRRTLKIADALGPSYSGTIALHSSYLSEALKSEGKLDEAETLIRRSAELYERRLGPDNPRFAGALKAMASIEALRGSDSEAEAHYRQALAIDEKVIGSNSSSVADDLVDLAPLQKRAGKFRDAREAIERALAIKVGQFGEGSPTTTAALLALANTAYEVGNYTDARKLADRAREIQQRTFGAEHYAMAGSWMFAARLDIAQGKLDDANVDLDRAANITAKTLAPDYPSNISILESREDIARARGNLADAERCIHDALSIAQKLYEPDYPVVMAAVDRLTGELWAQGKFEDAERLRRDQLGSIELKRGADHPSVAVALRGVAAILGGSARQREAAVLYRRALAIDELTFGPQSDGVAWDHLVLGSSLRKTGQFDDARREINLARSAWEDEGHLLAANSALEQLALLALDQGVPAESIIFVERMLSNAEQAVGVDSPALTAILAQLGRLYLVVGRDDAAESTLARIDRLIGEDPPEQAPGFLHVLQLRAQLSAEHGDVAGAETMFLRAIAVATKYGGVQADAVGANCFNLAVAYQKAGRFQDAIKSYARALGIFKRESGERSPNVGYALLGAARGYEEAGDGATSKALYAAAVEILGPTIAAQRQQPTWL